LRLKGKVKAGSKDPAFFFFAMIFGMRIFRWLLISVFFASVLTLCIVRSTGYTGAEEVGRKYFVNYKSTRTEVSRAEYEDVRWRSHVSTGAVVVMGVCLLGIGWMEKFWVFRRRETRTHQFPGR
jgi:hypothetical protein